MFRCETLNEWRLGRIMNSGGELWPARRCFKTRRSCFRPKAPTPRRSAGAVQNLAAILRFRKAMVAFTSGQATQLHPLAAWRTISLAGTNRRGDIR
jgi:hypothetical protein